MTIDQKITKQEIKELAKQVNQILNEWDPIEVADDHDNEYVFYIDPLISMLTKKATREELRKYLIDVVENQMGFGSLQDHSDIEIA